MDTTRRAMLGGALAASFLAAGATSATAAATPAQMGTVSDGWVEVWWTPEAEQQMERASVTVRAIEPTELVRDQDRPGLRFPVRAAQGDPSLTDPVSAEGEGVLEGGLVLQAPSGEISLMEMSGVLQGESVWGTYALNGVDTGMSSVFTTRIAEAKIGLVPGPAGQAVDITVSQVPLLPTAEFLEVFTRAFGTPIFTVDTVIAHVTAEGRYTPPRSR